MVLSNMWGPFIIHVRKDLEKLFVFTCEKNDSLFDILSKEGKKMKSHDRCVILKGNCYQWIEEILRVT